MSDDRYIDTPPAGPDDWRAVWREDRRYRAGGGALAPLVKLWRRLVGRATGPELDRQRDFNLVLLDLVRDVRGELDALRRDLKADLAAVQADVRRADEAIAREVASIRELIPVAAKRNDALIAALDQKIETLAVRVRDVTNPIVASTQASNASPSLASDVLYRRLEDGMRGSEAEVRDAVAPYVARAREQQPLIDVGCGRGELLVACREAGIAARGFDTNERSIADLRARGIDATLAGIPQCFAGLADGSVGSIVAMHVVEHLPVELLFALFTEAARVLRRGGLLMIETPNAEALAVTGSTFWRDPTHLAPRHPAALVLLAREHGFAVEELRAVHPFPEANLLRAAESDPESMQRLVARLNEQLFPPQDVRLILRSTSEYLGVPRSTSEEK